MAEHPPAARLRPGKPRTDVLDIASLIKSYDATTAGLVRAVCRRICEVLVRLPRRGRRHHRAQVGRFHQRPARQGGDGATSSWNLLSVAVNDAAARAGEDAGCARRLETPGPRVGDASPARKDAFRRSACERSRTNAHRASKPGALSATIPRPASRPPAGSARANSTTRSSFPSTQPNPVTAYWKNLTYKGLELLAAAEAKGRSGRSSALQRFPLAAPKPGVDTLTRRRAPRCPREDRRGPRR